MTAYTLLIDSTQKPQELERDLDAPLRWELSGDQMREWQRRVDAERNQSGVQAFQRLMRTARR